MPSRDCLWRSLGLARITCAKLLLGKNRILRTAFQLSICSGNSLPRLWQRLKGLRALFSHFFAGG
jgi:hypothetical protein